MDGIHIALQAEKITEIWGIPITNTLITSWAVIALLLFVAFLVNKKIRLIPGKLQIFFEIMVEGILDYIGRDNIHPGDFIIGNDPYIVRFGPLPDWSFVRPVFYEGEPMFYLYFRTHQHDSGGAYQAAYFPLTHFKVKIVYCS